MLNAFAKYSEVPIINLESAMHHPCQAMADMMTIREKLGARTKRVVLTWAWHPKPLPMAVPNSFALAAAQMGHDLVIAHPRGYELDEELMETDASEISASGWQQLKSPMTLMRLLTGAEVDLCEELGRKAVLWNRRKEKLKNARSIASKWIVDEEKMARTNERDLHALSAGASQRDCH